MPKKLVNFRLSDAGLADLDFCVKSAKLRMAHYGYMPVASQSEIVEQALARLAKYYRSLKLPLVKAPAVKRK